MHLGPGSGPGRKRSAHRRAWNPVEEAEEVVRDRYEAAVGSQSSGRPTVFGWTSTGKHLAVIFEIVDEDVPQVYVVTAFEAPPPAEPKRRRKKR